MKNILVAVGLEENSIICINKAAELAEKFGSKVWVLHVAAPNPDFVGYEVGPQYIRDARADDLKKEHRLIAEYIDHLKTNGIEADGLLVAGATIEIILQEITKLKIDIVITGHHQHGVLYKIFAGNNTDFEIVKRSKVPVMIVPL